MFLKKSRRTKGSTTMPRARSLREWIDNPVQLDPPHPVGAEAVQVLTVHQAKGLEFPVVAIWDGKGQWNARLQASPWRMERDGCGWMINLDKLTWEEPAGLGIREAEQQYLDAERRRVAYVAATRARDLLIVPKAGTVPAGKFMCGDFLADVPERLVQTTDAYVPGTEPAWSRQLKALERKAPGGRIGTGTTGSGAMGEFRLKPLDLVFVPQVCQRWREFRRMKRPKMRLKRCR